MLYSFLSSSTLNFRPKPDQNGSQTLGLDLYELDIYEKIINVKDNAFDLPCYPTKPT